MNKFYVFEIFRQAPRVVFGKTGPIFRAILIPVILMTAVQLVANSQLFSWLGFGWRRLGFGVFEWLAAAPFLVAWYRYVLSPLAPTPLRYRIRRSDFPFYAYTAGFAAALLTSFVAGNVVFGDLGPEVIRFWLTLSNTAGAGAAGIRASLLEVGFLLLVLAVWLRLIFVFPASATGDRLGLAGSWILSANHHLKIFWVLVFIAMLFALIGVFVLAVLVSIVSGALGRPAISTTGMANASLIATLILTNIYMLFAMAAQVAAVALMYRALKGNSAASHLAQPWGEED